MAEERDLSFVKRTFRALLISAKNGLTLEQLVRDYQMVIGEDVPLSSLGFKSVMQLVSSMPDVVQVQKRSGRTLLKGVPDGSVEHIARMVASQKQGKVYSQLKSAGVNGRSRPPNQLNNSTPVEPALPVVFKVRVKSLMMCYREGLPLKDFNEAYRKRFGCYPDVRRYGFSDLASALLSLTDLIRVKYDTEKTEMMVYSVKKCRHGMQYKSLYQTVTNLRLKVIYLISPQQWSH